MTKFELKFFAKHSEIVKKSNNIYKIIHEDSAKYLSHIYDDDAVLMFKGKLLLLDHVGEYELYKDVCTKNYFVIDTLRCKVIFEGADYESGEFYTIGKDVYVRVNKFFGDVLTGECITKFFTSYDVYPEMIVLYFPDVIQIISEQGITFVMPCIVNAANLESFHGSVDTDAGLFAGVEDNKNLKFRYVTKRGFVSDISFSSCCFGKYKLFTRDDDGGLIMIDLEDSNEIRLPEYKLWGNFEYKSFFAVKDDEDADDSHQTVYLLNGYTGEVKRKYKRLIFDFEKHAYGTRTLNLAVVEDKDGRVFYVDESGQELYMPESDEKSYLYSSRNLFNDHLLKHGCEDRFEYIEI